MKHVFKNLISRITPAILFAALFLGTLTQAVLDQLHMVDSIGLVYFLFCAFVFSTGWLVALVLGSWGINTKTPS